MRIAEHRIDAVANDPSRAGLNIDLSDVIVEDRKGTLYGRFVELGLLFVDDAEFEQVLSASGELTLTFWRRVYDDVLSKIRR